MTAPTTTSGRACVVSAIFGILALASHLAIHDLPATLLGLISVGFGVAAGGCWIEEAAPKKRDGYGGRDRL